VAVVVAVVATSVAAAVETVGNRIKHLFEKGLRPLFLFLVWMVHLFHLTQLVSSIVIFVKKSA
jgi:hypothetical protein